MEGVMAGQRLQVFISYASEDEHLATAIAEELRTAFGLASLRVLIAAEVGLGTPWRKQIEDDLDSADILLIVATGIEKLSHSFTGFEVGYFKGSRRSRPRMAHFDSDRLVIPIAIATTIPGTVDDTQGVQLDGPLKPLMIDHELLKDQERFAQAVDYASDDNPLLKLFKRILSIIGASSFNEQELAPFQRQIRDSSKRLHQMIFSELRKRISTEIFPERKIVIRVDPSVGTGTKLSDDVPAGATVEFHGRSFDVFGFETPPQGRLDCKAFLASIPNKRVAAIWSDIIRSQVLAARQQNFRENRRLITSPDKTRFFRIFAANSVLYFSGENEIHIYVVEVKSRDFGDRTTTMLLKAIQVGLQYRFMFLEQSSEFSPASIGVTLKDQLRGTVSDLIQELEYLLWMSKDAGLDQPETLLRIYGHNLEPGWLDQKAVLWEEKRAALYAAAYAVLGSDNDRDLIASKAKFIPVLEDFCEATREMNREFTSRTLRAVQEVVSTPFERDHLGGAAAPSQQPPDLRVVGETKPA
jgi:TIR domain